MNEKSKILKDREQNLEAIKEMGIDPFPKRFDYTRSVSKILDIYGDYEADRLESELNEERVPGRITAVREHGKAAFLDISDGVSTLQIYIKKDEVGKEAFELFGKLDIGDYIGTEGVIFRTRTDELTLKVDSFCLLAKAMRPLPEKWHGLSDIEKRYRRRSLDLISNPEIRENFEIRSRVIKVLREYLDSEGFMEVETPMMQSVPAGAEAEPFKTHHNALNIDLFLRIAPELYLKRLVVGGMEKVYEINRNFRNEGISNRHNPEFTMLEFYKAYSDYEDVMDITVDMLKHTIRKIMGELSLEYQGKEVDFGGKWDRLTLTEALEEYTDIKTSGLESYDDAVTAAERENVDVSECESRWMVVKEIFDELVEDKLIKPTFIVGFPIEESPLAKISSKDERLVERFELFAGGLEIANAYTELNDPAEQKRRMETQNRVDRDYIRALEHGMPPTGGFGLGVDRFVMLMTDSASIKDVILFPQMRPKSQD